MKSSLLVVDDFVDTLSALGELFSMDGWDVRTASSAGEAVALMKERPASIVWIDEDLFDMRGTDLAFHLKAIAHLHDPDFRCITLAVRGDFSPRLDTSGFDHFIAKPVDFNQVDLLLNSLDESLDTAPALEWGLF